MKVNDEGLDQGQLGYIQNELSANIPTSWVLTTLGEPFKWGSGGTPRSGNAQFYGGDIPWLVIGDLNDGVVQDSATKITELGLKNSSAKLVEAGSILLAMYGSIGKLGIAGKPLATNQAIAFTKTNEISPLYLFFFLRYVNNRLARLGKGATQLNISQTVIKAFPFVLAPKSEQHRIVAKIEELFSELDKGIENLKTAQAQLKVYRQALLKHAFEGKLSAQWRVENQGKLETADALQKRIQQERAQRYQQQLTDWEAAGKQGGKPKAPKPLPPLTTEELAELPELPKGWGWVKVGNIGSVGTGITPLKGRSDFYANGNIPWVTSGALNNNFVTEASDYVTDLALKETNLRIYPKHTLLIALYGEGKTRGKCSELLIEATTNQAIAAIVQEGISENLRKYMKWFFQKNYGDIRLKSSGGVQPNLNLSIIENTLFPMCSMDEAIQVVDVIESKLSEVDQLDQTITTSLQQAEALRQSILKKAFSGQLVAQDANDEPASVLLARIKTEKAAQADVAKSPKLQKVQPAPTRSNVIPFPIKIPNISPTDLHAGIIARAYQLHARNSEHLAYYGHVKAEKISHLVEAHLGIDLERVPFKDAAGPNDYPHLKKVESRARKANWFEVRQAQKNGAYVFSRQPGFDALLNKTALALGNRLNEVDALLKLLLPMNTRQAEIVATIYAAWNNLLLLGQSPDDEDIVTEARENWHESKLKIERERFFRALGWMREHGLVPVGRGRYVEKKSK
ncbi:MAG TPA: restriction endonuclease subunit S [Methylophilaceae bacterium]|nr:restriction endonuclease subunit S [Methylophilaceae bacterium]